MKRLIVVLPIIFFLPIYPQESQNADSLFMLGKDYLNRSKLDSSIVFFDKASSLYENLHQYEQYIDCKVFIAHALIYSSAYNEANIHLSEVNLEARKLFNYPNGQIIAINNARGHVNNYLGFLDSALFYYEKAKELIDNLYADSLLPSKAYIRSNIGVIHEIKGDYHKALQYKLEGLKKLIDVQGENSANVGGMYNNVGVSYDNLGEYNLAIDFYSKALQIRQSQLGENHPYVADTYNNIGVSFQALKEYDKALENKMKAMEIRVRVFGKDHYHVAQSYNNIGSAYDDLGLLDSALKYKMLAAKIYAELVGENNVATAQSYTNIGVTYSKQKQLDSAKNYWDKSLEIYENTMGDKHPEISFVHRNAAQMYADNGELEPAFEEIQKAIVANLKNVVSKDLLQDSKNVEHISDKKEMLKTLALKCKILYYLSETKDAEHFLKTALETSILCDTILDVLKKTYHAKTDKIQIANQAMGIYEIAVKVAWNLHHLTNNKDYLFQAFYFAEKNKASVLLEALANTEAQKYAGIPDSLLEIEKKLKLEIMFYKNKMIGESKPDKLAEYRNQIFDYSRKHEQLIDQFEKSYPAYYQLKYLNQSIAISDIQSIIDERTNVISYFTGDSTIYVFSVLKNKFEVYQIGESENIIAYADLFRNLLSEKQIISNQDLFNRLARRLYKSLIPFEIDKDVENVILIPDGILSLIPFEVFYTKDVNLEQHAEFETYPYFVKDYNISYSYSANLFYQTFHKIAHDSIELSSLKDWIAFAPVFHDQNTGRPNEQNREFLRTINYLEDNRNQEKSLMRETQITPLPGTENEVNNINKAFESNNRIAKINLHGNASESILKSGDVKNYKFLHIATHGFVNAENPELSGILLAQNSDREEDGILFTGEIYNIDINADLTILSACETGLGKITKSEGLIGLSRALLYAGTKNIIVSLWKVADNSTSVLMTSFYEKLLEQDEMQKNYSYALSEAKRDMIKNKQYAHPFYWSPFVLIGR